MPLIALFAIVAGTIPRAVERVKSRVPTPAHGFRDDDVCCLHRKQQALSGPIGCAIQIYRQRCGLLGSHGTEPLAARAAHDHVDMA